MNCTCGGATKVVDRRGQRRRRECLVCGERFSTVEVLEKDAPEQDKQPAPKKPATVQAQPKPAATSRPKPTAPTAPAAQAERKVPAWRRIQDLREQLEDYRDGI